MKLASRDSETTITPRGKYLIMIGGMRRRVISCEAGLAKLSRQCWELITERAELPPESKDW